MITFRTILQIPTPIYRPFLKFAFLLFVLTGIDAYAGERTIIGLELKGAKRTDPEWVIRHLGLDFPQTVTDDDLVAYATKLLTTQVFKKVTIATEPTTADPDSYLMLIELEEKWTFIPVVRGAFGGGTPLAVMGMYDTHSFGNLWTIGGEVRRYGTAPWGGVVWVRAPRALQGQHEQGIEFWRQFRVRTLFDDEDEPLGTIRSDWSMLRVLLLNPFPTLDRLTGKSSSKIGVDVRMRSESPTSYQVDDEASSDRLPEGINLSDDYSRQVQSLVRVVYDDVTVNNLDHDGERFVGLVGPSFEGAETHSVAEIDAFSFSYHQWSKINFAAHAFLGQSTSPSVESQYFLGGFESIRGIPDGAVYGNRAAYLNLELRRIVGRFKYAWFQPTTFIDMGSASNSWRVMKDHFRSSAGLGLRIAVPQVYRLMFRIDYAWSLDQPGTSGITAGMNQFFQPYKPL